jgi:hypothetical protein
VNCKRRDWHISDDARPAKGRAKTKNSRAFDHSASLAEHLKNFLVYALRGFCGRFPAIRLLFGIFLPNAAPTVMRAARRGERPLGASHPWKPFQFWLYGPEQQRRPLGSRPGSSGN